MWFSMQLFKRQIWDPKSAVEYVKEGPPTSIKSTFLQGGNSEIFSPICPTVLFHQRLAVGITLPITFLHLKLLTSFSDYSP